jgi:hypothetical protein
METIIIFLLTLVLITERELNFISLLDFSYIFFFTLDNGFFAFYFNLLCIESWLDYRNRRRHKGYFYSKEQKRNFQGTRSYSTSTLNAPNNNDDDWYKINWFNRWLIEKVYNFSLYLVTWFKPNSYFINLIDNFILTNFANKSYHSYLNNFIILKSEIGKYDSLLNLVLYNWNELTGKLLYIHYYYAIISNHDFINFAAVKVFIGRAKLGEKGYTLHNNFLYINSITQPTLNDFLIHIEPNLIHLLSMAYFDDAPEYINVTVWDASKATRLKLNENDYIKSQIKKNIIETIKKTFNKPLNFTRANFPLYSPVNLINNFNVRNFNSRANNFTPLTNKDNYFNKINNIVAVDIETMFWKDSSRHIPVLITIAHFNNYNRLITNFFLIDIQDVENMGYDYAANNMWKNFFNYLVEYIDPSSIIFTHNLGSFDGLYIYFNLLNKAKNINKNSSIIDKDNKFIQIIANIEGHKFTFKDSMRLFPVSLNDLCQAFNVQGKISKHKDEWSNFNLFDNEKELCVFIKYALQDSISLLKALTTAQSIYSTNYKVDISTIWSTATLSLKIFRQSFLKNIIPSLNNYLDNYIRSGYFGGATDHYKRYGENLYHYDVNSLYPAAMLNDMPLNYVKFHNNIKDLNNFFGFCLAKIECPLDIKIPILPYRDHNSRIIFPRGIWKGVYFSEQLKAAIKYGYKISPINGHEFTRAKLFNDYIQHFYDIKKNASGGLRFIAKMQLNQLYGYFGRSRDLIITQNVNREELNNILLIRIVSNVIKINNDTFIVLMHGNLNHNLIKQIKDHIDLTGLKDINKNVKSNVAISAAVTAYAQIEMMKYKALYPDNIYYTDTDSIFLDVPLASEMVGNELGQMKDELSKLNTKIINKAIFLGNKQYAYNLINNKGENIHLSKWSGAKKNTISWDEMISISNGNIITKEYDNVFYRDFTNLSINIQERKISLKNLDSKKINNNNYQPPFVFNTNHKFHDQNILQKITNKTKYLIKYFLNNI